METVPKSSNKDFTNQKNNIESKDPQKSKQNNCLKPNINLNEYPEYPNGRKVQQRSIRRPKVVIQNPFTASNIQQSQLNRNTDLFPLQTIDERQILTTKAQKK